MNLQGCSNALDLIRKAQAANDSRLRKMTTSSEAYQTPSRLSQGDILRSPTNRQTHKFDLSRHSLTIQHPLTKVHRLQTNGTAGSLNGQHHPHPKNPTPLIKQTATAHILRPAYPYNNHLTQANLHLITSHQAMSEFHENSPQFFDEYVHNRPEKLLGEDHVD